MRITFEGTWMLNSLNRQMDIQRFPVLQGTASDDDITISIYGPSGDPNFLPIARAGAGDDMFFGDAMRAYGGSGDDVFYNNGWDMYRDGPGFSYSYGQGGNDTFIDFSGSTQYFGGAGSDYFTNSDFTTHSFEGDHDIVDLGNGHDSAFWDFATISDVDGLSLEDRFAEIDGGNGFDTLILNQSNASVVIYGPSEIDFRNMNNGTLAIGNAEFTDFEQVNLVFGSHRLSEVGLTNGDDVLRWFDMNREDDTLNVRGDRPANAPTDPLIIRGFGGDDIIFGSLYRDVEFIYGGGGNDILSGAGGTQEVDFATVNGGAGDDFLFGSIETTTSYHNARFIGGAGADTFVFKHFNNGIRVLDYEQGEDQILLYFASPIETDIEVLNAVTQDDFADLVILQDNQDALEFTFTADFVTGFNFEETFRFLYDRQTGELFLEYETDVPYDGFGDAVATFVDAPNLTLDDFAFIDQTGYDMLA